jgi:type I restriction enzyme R subunit
LVQQALRKTLYIQFKIPNQDVYETALGYVREYY